MLQAFQGLWEVHIEKKVPLRTAAFIKALQRCGAAGLLPAALLPVVTVAMRSCMPTVQAPICSLAGDCGSACNAG